MRSLSLAEHSERIGALPVPDRRIQSRRGVGLVRGGDQVVALVVGEVPDVGAIELLALRLVAVNLS